MKHVLTGILIVLLTVVQTTVLRGIEIFHVIPNLLFIFVVCYSLLRSDYSALFVAAVCGLVLDVLGGRAIGINTLLCTLSAYTCVAVSGSLFNNNSFVAMVFVLLLSLPYELFIYVFYFVIWGRGALGFVLLHKLIPAVLYNFVMTLLIYPVARLIVGENAQP